VFRIAPKIHEVVYRCSDWKRDGDDVIGTRKLIQVGI
jgi:hypothetical protein